MSYIVHATDTDQLTGPARDAVRVLDPNLPISASDTPGNGKRVGVSW